MQKYICKKSNLPRNTILNPSLKCLYANTQHHFFHGNRLFRISVSPLFTASLFISPKVSSL